jgi:hypothetical protein
VAKHQFQVSTSAGTYEFLYDQKLCSLCLVQWPDCTQAMRIIAAGLPRTIKDATVAAKRYTAYIEANPANR